MTLLRSLFLALAALMVANVAAAQGEYRIKSGDTLVVEVLEDTGLNRSLRVLSDGRVNFPFAGNIRVRGRTVGEVETIITSGIRSNFAAEPNVFVSVVPADVVPAAPREPEPDPVMGIFFMGEVNSPGMVEVEPGTRFLQGMAMSGGLTRFAADKRIQLRRTDDRTGNTVLFEINYRAILDGASIENNIVLEEGDVIIVPERRLFE